MASRTASVFGKLATIITLGSGVSATLPPAVASPAAIVPAHVLRQIKDDELRPLPRARAGSGIPTVELGDLVRVPAGEMRVPAEYEPSAGIVVRWGSFNDVLAQVIVGVTTADPQAIAWIVVADPPQRDRARAVLRRAGADLDHTRFIAYRADSAWVRDYGPRHLAEPGRGVIGRALLDHTYNRSRPRDDAFPDFLSELWSEEQYDLPLVHAGGNVHVFGDGEAFVTDLILAENPDLATWELHAYFLTLGDHSLTVWPSFPISFDHTGHIDMWMLPVRDREAIVGRYRPATGRPHLITERAAAELEQRGYTVHRTPGWRSKGRHFTYTNALIFNELVFVPTYREYPRRNLAAMGTYRKAFPRHQIIPVESTRMAGFAGAIHCAVLQIPRLEAMGEE